jgi:integrase
MARTAKNAKVDSRSARSKLPARREPYWTKIQTGGHLGYRRITTGGFWIARYRDAAAGKRTYHALGSADDFADHDGENVFSFDAAQEAARKYFKRRVAELAGDWAPDNETLTVREAMALYLAEFEKRGKGLAQARSVINAHILPTLGGVAVARLTRARLVTWRDAIADGSARVRSKQNGPVKYRKGHSNKRQRQSTTNRILTVLKAGLNFVRNEGRVSCRPVWELVKPYRNADSSRVRYLNDDESRSVVKVCPKDFAELVTGALLSGCRYSELASLLVSDFITDSGSIHIRDSKNGTARHVYLTTEGIAFFKKLCKGKRGTARIFQRADGRPWQKSDQARPLDAACKAAKLGNLTFHELRHTYASRLVMGGVGLPVVAKQLGHTSTRMVDKHYGHLAPSYVADTVRAAFNPLIAVSELEAAE